MHFKYVFTWLQQCVLVGLDWAEPMIFFKFTCYMFMHFSCIRTFIYLYFDIDLCWCFSVCFFLSLFLLVSCSMAPKRKSTPSQNPLHSGASFSSPSDSTPSHVQFYDDNARKDFSENISRWGIHLERQVVLSNFFDTDLPTIIYSRGWESLCGIPVTCPSMII